MRNKYSSPKTGSPLTEVANDTPCREDINQIKRRLARQIDNLDLLMEVQDRGLVHYEEINRAIGEMYSNIYSMKKELKARKAKSKKRGTK